MVAALVAGLVVGAAIGWKVEQSRVKDDVKNAKAAARSGVGKRVRPFGVVTAVDASSVTIRLQTGAKGTRTFKLTGDTIVDRGVAGDTSDIAKGATVLVRPRERQRAAGCDRGRRPAQLDKVRKELETPTM